MQTVVINNPPITTIRALLKSAGTNIGSVYFIKKEDGSLRKMCYRLHVKNPKSSPFKTEINKDKQKTNKEKGLITVYDVNKVVRNCYGEKTGRGQWRTLYLKNVTRIVADGVQYIIKRSENKSL